MCVDFLVASWGLWGICNLIGDIFQGWAVKSNLQCCLFLRLLLSDCTLGMEVYPEKYDNMTISHWDWVCACIEEEREERKPNLSAHLLENISKGTSLASASSLASAHLFSHFPDEPALLGGLRAHTTCLWDGGWYTGCLCSFPVCFVEFPDVCFVGFPGVRPLTVSCICHLAVAEDEHLKPTKACVNSQHIECCSVAAMWLFTELNGIIHWDVAKPCFCALICL